MLYSGRHIPNVKRCFDFWHPCLLSTGLGWQCVNRSDFPGCESRLGQVRGAVSSAGNHLNDPARSYDEQYSRHRYSGGQGSRAPCSQTNYGAHS